MSCRICREPAEDVAPAGDYLEWNCQACRRYRISQTLLAEMEALSLRLDIEPNPALDRDKQCRGCPGAIHLRSPPESPSDQLGGRCLFGSGLPGVIGPCKCRHQWRVDAVASQKNYPCQPFTVFLAVAGFGCPAGRIAGS